MLIKIKNSSVMLSKKLMVFFLALASITSISAQFNTEIGYSLSYITDPSNKLIIDKYNQNQEMIRNMKNIRFINGFNAGLTYRTGLVRFGGFWESQTAKRTGIEGSLLGEAREKALFYYFNSIGGGIALIGNYMGIGATVDYSLFRLKTSKSGVKERINVINVNHFSNKAYLIFYLRLNSKLAIEFKPYVRIPWKNVDLYPMADYLGVSRDPAFRSANFFYYGISFSILNGRQHD